MSGKASINTLIFDLGDVLFSWSASKTTSISPGQLKSILDGTTWHEYECDLIDQATCYERCAQKYETSTSQIQEAFNQARASLTANLSLVKLIKELRASNTQLRVYAMSNISVDDYDFLRKERGDTDWSVFDQVFTSAAAHVRKPSLSFFRHVLHNIGGDPSTMMFVDDRKENVVAAQSCGMGGFVYGARDTTQELERVLRNALYDPITRASDFLAAHRGRLTTYIEDGTLLEENFTQLLIFEVTQDKSLISIVQPTNGHLWNYFQGTPLKTTSNFPCDLDTTSLALTTLPIAQEDALSVMNQMLKYVNNEGIVMTYFDKNRVRTDPVVCINVLSLFYTYGRHQELFATQAWVINVLKHRAYLRGTRYYCTPESFLYFFHRLLLRAPPLEQVLRPILLQHTLERVGEPGDALARAMRVLILAHNHQSTAINREIKALRELQESDGGWPTSYVYAYGSSALRIGSRGLSTAFAISALRAWTAQCHVNGDLSVGKPLVGRLAGLDGLADVFWRIGSMSWAQLKSRQTMREGLVEI